MFLDSLEVYYLSSQSKPKVARQTGEVLVRISEKKKKRVDENFSEPLSWYSQNLGQHDPNKMESGSCSRDSLRSMGISTFLCLILIQVNDVAMKPALCLNDCRQVNDQGTISYRVCVREIKFSSSCQTNKKNSERDELRLSNYLTTAEAVFLEAVCCLPIVFSSHCAWSPAE